MDGSHISLFVQFPARAELQQRSPCRPFLGNWSLRWPIVARPRCSPNEIFHDHVVRFHTCPMPCLSVAEPDYAERWFFSVCFRSGELLWTSVEVNGTSEL